MKHLEHRAYVVHQLIKEKFLENPDVVVKKSLEYLLVWKDSGKFCNNWIEEWCHLLHSDSNEIIRILDGKDKKSILMRTFSPMISVLSDDEKSKLYNLA